MNFDEWFDKQSQVLKIVLLAIPFVGWIIEILVRISAYSKNKNTIDLVILLAFILIGYGYVLNIIDIIWVALKGRLFYAADIDTLNGEDVKDDDEPAKDAKPQENKEAADAEIKEAPVEETPAEEEPKEE